MKLFIAVLVWAYLSPGFTAVAAPADALLPRTPVASSKAVVPTTLEGMTARYNHQVKHELKKRSPDAKCNAKNVRVRKEWGALSGQQRIAYTDAVKCLHSLPSKSSPADAPGARSRFDDFLAAHIEQAYSIHYSGNLYVWHRAFTWYYETALRTECGYRGTQPYWDWTLYADDPRYSPLLDGSPTSMGGNGETIVHGATLVNAFGLELLAPPGTGGGCVQKGPFANWTVNLGLDLEFAKPQRPRARSIPLHERGSPDPSSQLKYNPRCLTRDINLQWSAQTKKSDVEFVLRCPNADCLEKRADGWELDRSLPQPALHAAGHLSVGGLQADPFASPGDPIFYLHHAQIDRVWAIWQAQDCKNRKYQVGGTKTPFNIPPSAHVSLNDQLEFGVTGKKLKLKDAMSPIDGDFCYRYE